MSGGESTPLHRKVLIGLVAGAVIGIVANQIGANSPEAKEKVAFVADAIAHPIGQIFLRLLFLVVIPLVFASLTVGVAGLGNLNNLGRLGWRTLLYFFLTTGVSVLMGMTLMRTFEPGVGFDEVTRAELQRDFSADAAKLATTANLGATKTTLETANQFLDMFLPRNVLRAVVEMQMLPLIVFAILFGVALTMLAAPRRDAMVAWLETVGEAMVRIVGIAMKLAPYAVFCLVFSVVAKFGHGLLEKLALYVGLVLAAYLVQIFVLYPVLLTVLARRKPLKFLRSALPVLVTAFSTSSSNATLPTSIRVSTTDLGIRPRVAGFVLPLGATMNMNGTALFEGALILFIAQIFGVELSMQQQILVVFLCVFSAIGAAGVPGGALPLIMTVMAQVGIPPDGIAIVLGVDRLLDMGRTVTNVLGDLVCAAWIERVEEQSGASS